MKLLVQIYLNKYIRWNFIDNKELNYFVSNNDKLI